MSTLDAASYALTGALACLILIVAIVSAESWLKTTTRDAYARGFNDGLKAGQR